MNERMILKFTCIVTIPYLFRTFRRIHLRTRKKFQVSHYRSQRRHPNVIFFLPGRQLMIEYYSERNYLCLTVLFGVLKGAYIWHSNPSFWKLEYAFHCRNSCTRSLKSIMRDMFIDWTKNGKIWQIFLSSAIINEVLLCKIDTSITDKLWRTELWRRLNEVNQFQLHILVIIKVLQLRFIIQTSFRWEIWI